MYLQYPKHKPSLLETSQTMNQNTFFKHKEAKTQNVAAPHQWRCRSECRPSLSVISAAFMAFGRSCLFAKTSSTASRSSSCTVTKRPSNQLPILYYVDRISILQPRECSQYLVQHPMQLVSGFHHTISVVTIHHEDQALRVLEIMPPQWPNLQYAKRKRKKRLTQIIIAPSHKPLTLRSGSAFRKNKQHNVHNKNTAICPKLSRPPT